MKNPQIKNVWRKNRKKLFDVKKKFWKSHYIASFKGSLLSPIDDFICFPKRPHLLQKPRISWRGSCVSTRNRQVPRFVAPIPGLRIRSDPDLFGGSRSRIRKTFTGSVSGSYRYPTLAMGSCINKETHIYTFSGEFFHFFDKNNHHSNIRRNMFDVKKNLDFWIDSW